MSKCDCCKEEFDELVNYNDYKLCPACYMGFVSIVKVCKNNIKYETVIDQLKQQLAKKDKEIEKLNKTLEMCKHIERYDIGEMFLENAKLIIEKRQLAIQELEKVKVNLKDRITMMSNEEHSYLQKVVIWYDICNQVNKQIKELKGEKECND